MKAHCRRCNADTEHRHAHDTAHGIPETHMDGSEYFECRDCGLKTFAGDGEGDFTFILDKKHG